MRHFNINNNQTKLIRKNKFLLRKFCLYFLCHSERYGINVDSIGVGGVGKGEPKKVFVFFRPRVEFGIGLVIV